MEFKANWITVAADMGDICPVFRKTWSSEKKVVKAELYLTALGVYEAVLNGKRVGEYVLAPGWTSYEKRLQYQCYDVTKLLSESNVLTVTVGRGWMRSPMPGWRFEEAKKRYEKPCGIIAELHLTYEDGSREALMTDTSWTYAESKIRFSEIYDGEIYDAGYEADAWLPVCELEWPKDILIAQEGEEIREMERVQAKAVITTPAGETLVDFGQIVTGYVEFTVDARANDVVRILHGEVLDRYGNFYNENYRRAKAEIVYTCADGIQTWHPVMTFFGFRYLKLVEFPGEAKPEQFTAIAVYSNMKKTGSLRSSDPMLNQLFSNIFWG